MIAGYGRLGLHVLESRPGVFTSADSLIEQLLDADAAIGEAVRALGEAAPNPRDYYPQGPDAYTVAARKVRR